MNPTHRKDAGMHIRTTNNSITDSDMFAEYIQRMHPTVLGNAMVKSAPNLIARHLSLLSTRLRMETTSGFVDLSIISQLRHIGVAIELPWTRQVNDIRRLERERESIFCNRYS